MVAKSALRKDVVHQGQMIGLTPAQTEFARVLGEELSRRWQTELAKIDPCPSVTLNVHECDVALQPDPDVGPPPDIIDS